MSPRAPLREARRDPARRESRGPAWWLLMICSALVLLLGLAMLGLGGWLVALGGTWYYLLAGAGATLAAVAVFSGRIGAGVGMYALVVLATVLWSLLEIHAKGWMHSWGFDLAGRAGVLSGLLVVMALAWMRLRGAGPGRAITAALVVAMPVVLVASGAALVGPPGPEVPAGVTEVPFAEGRLADESGHDAAHASRPPRAGMGRAAVKRGPEEWTAYGGSNLGQRFSEATQITRDNVSRLEQAWEFRTGDERPDERVYYAFQNTPLKIDDSLYVCTSGNQVFALHPATGEVQWHYDPQVPTEAMEPLFSVACRAVGYHEAAPGTEVEECLRRIMLATVDSRLIALDAGTGALCPGFGDGGTLDIAEGMGNQAIGISSNTSGPAIVGDLAIVGQQVSDNQRRDAPSGVVRAFDVFSGDFVWAWDAKRIDRPGEPLAPGELWPRGTPNVWTIITADETLGLVFLATGNATNDHWGGDRTPEDEEFTSTVVAVDAGSGEMRWHFRTIDHDLWDYDLGAQPTVMDLDVDGETRRVLIQGSKDGNIYVLDARTGEPVRPVEREPAPQGAVAGDWTAPDQRRSPFYPNFAATPGPRAEVIDARHAWGLTPIDALYCRIQFHRMRYEGLYTPPTDQGEGMLLFPGTIGGINWGGVSVNPDAQILITNNSRLPNRVKLYPREEVDSPPIGEADINRPDQDIAPQAGAPFGVDRPMWLSPLGVPCIAPPWGYLSATDLRTGELLWSNPLGTGFDTGPFGIPTFVKIRLGTANIGGSVNTRSGLTFIAAAQDNYLRAFDTYTGELLWDGRLPAGGQASPITYMHEGRQYVAIAAGGHARLETTLGDSIMVFALPEDEVAREGRRGGPEDTPR